MPPEPPIAPAILAQADPVAAPPFTAIVLAISEKQRPALLVLLPPDMVTAELGRCTAPENTELLPAPHVVAVAVADDTSNSPIAPPTDALAA